MYNAVIVDISGRHRLPDGHYRLVCVAVYAVLSPLNIQQIKDVKIVDETTGDVSIEVVAAIILKAAVRFDGTLVTERGEFYNYPAWRVEAILGRKFKYVESIGERRAMEVAHHVSLAVRRILQESS